MTEVGKISVAIEGDSSKLQDAARKGASAVGQAAGSMAQSGQTLATVWKQIGESGGAGMQVFAGGLIAAGLAFIAFKAAAAMIAPVLAGLRDAFATSLQDAMKWEEAFANVKKVLGDSANSSATKQLEDDLISLSTRIPVAATELAKFAQIGAQMGLQQSQLAGFAETIARISTSFDGATAETMALSLGKMQAQTKMTDDELRRFASSVMFVGAKTAATEAQIISVAEKWAGMGHIVGLTNSQLVGFAAEAASLNNRYAESGTAMFRMLQTFQRAADEGGKKAAAFAKTLNLPVEQFRKLAKENPAETFQRFMLALGGTDAKANNVSKTLRELGFTGRTTGGIFTAMANDSKGLAEALKFAAEEMERGTAIVEMSNLRWDTATMRMKLLGNAITATSIEVGRTFLPSLNLLLTALQPLGHAAYTLGTAFRTAFQRDLVESVRPAATILTDISVGLDVVALQVLKLAKAHGQRDEVKAFWSTFEDGFIAAVDAVLMNIPVLREAVSLLQVLRMVGASVGLEGRDLQSSARVLPPTGTRTPQEIAEEKAATDALIKMQERLREELDKLGDAHRTTYEKMIAEIERATAKRMVEARVVAKDNVGALRSMEQAIRDIDAGAKAAAQQALFEKMFGGLTEAEKQMVDFGDALKAMAKTGLEPTNEQLIFAHDTIRLFGEATATSLAKVETASPGAVAALERLYFITKKFFELKDVPIGKLPNITTPKNVPSLVGGVHFGKGDVTAFKEEIALFEEAKDKAELYKQKVKDIVDEHKGWALAVRTLDSLFKLLGVSADSFLGRMLAGATGGAEAISQFQRGYAAQFDKFNESTGKFEGFKFDTEGALEMGVAVVKLALAFKQATDSASTMERAVNGAILGAQAGFAATKTWQGAVVGAVVGAFAGAFMKPDWADWAEIIGRNMGVAVTKEMAKTIEASARDLGLSLKDASLLFLGQIIGNSKKTVEGFQHQIAELMIGVANHSIPAAKGIEQIGIAFGLAKNEAAQSGEVINRTMLGMILNARALGLEVTAISEHIKQNLNRAVSGVNTLFKPVSTKDQDKPGVKIAINTQADAEAAAAIFNAVFWGAVKEFGLIAAIDALEVPFNNLVAVLTEKGFDVAAIFGPVMAFFQYANNESFRGAAEGAAALRDGLIGLTNAGMLTEAAFHGFGHTAVQVYEQAYAASGDQNASIMATLPLLAALQQAHDLYGYQLTDEEQKLMDIAKANGIAFPKDPILQVRDAIFELIEAITGIPRTVNINVNTNRTHTGDPPPGHNNSLGHPKTDRDQDGYDDETGEPMKTGGLVRAARGGVHVILAEAGEDEFVVPASKVGSFAAQHGGGHESDTAILAELRALRRLMGRLPLELARSTRDAVQLGRA
jgi:TP901 family phage tail tape measure protein